MAVVRPFRGLRPRPDVASQVASPPYDVLSSDEARQLVADNPDSFLRVNKSEVDFEPGVPSYSDEVYQRGKENLDRLVSEGLMIRDETDCLYLYRLTWQGRSQTGLVCLTAVAEYDAGKIKKHEFTRPDKVNDRANHILSLNAQVGPVFSIFRHTDDIRQQFDSVTATTPTVDFTSDDEVRHELWVVNNKTTNDSLVAAFGELGELYIADGHHRSESASEVCRRLKSENANHTGDEPYNFFLNVLFADEETRILPYNRTVSDLNGRTALEMFEAAKSSFTSTPIETALSPKRDHCIGVYADGQWYKMTAVDGSFDSADPVGSIDAAILTANLLDPVLGIKDIRTDKRINFVGGIRGVAELERLVDSGKFEIAFSLYPVSVEQLLNVADAGQVMPPKSTWFEPKLRSGMVVNLLK